MKISRRIILVSLIGFCLVLVAFTNIPLASPHATGVSPLYASMLQKIPTLGGGLGTDWTDAWTGTITMQKIGTTTTQPANVYVKMDHRFIWIGLKIPDTTPTTTWHWHTTIFFIDSSHDGVLFVPGDRYAHDDYKVFTTGVIIYPPTLDFFWDGSSWYPDIWAPFPGSNDGNCGFYHDGSYMQIEAILPIDSLDRYDAALSRWNSIVGLCIEYWDGGMAPNIWVWPLAGPAQPQPDISSRPDLWGDLWTKAVFGATVPHAHDVPGQWISFLGLVNTGTRTSTVVFGFYDDLGNLLAVRTITLNPSAHYGNYVRLILGPPPWGTPFVGSIVIWSDQPFEGTLNTHDAAMTQMGVYPIHIYW